MYVGTLVRPKEATVVLIVVGLWFGAIRLFFNRLLLSLQGIFLKSHSDHTSFDGQVGKNSANGAVYPILHGCPGCHHVSVLLTEDQGYAGD